MQRKKYTAEFKANAVRVCESSDKSTAEIARELGLRPNVLQRWRAGARETRAIAAKPVVKGAARDVEMMRSQLQVKRLMSENDILKKALSLFAQQPR